MRSLAFLALAACATGGDDYPIVTQGGAAPGGAGGSASVIVGRVCVLSFRTRRAEMETCVRQLAEESAILLRASAGGAVPVK